MKHVQNCTYFIIFFISHSFKCEFQDATGIDPDKSIVFKSFSYPSVITYVLGAQKNRGALECP